MTDPVTAHFQISKPVPTATVAEEFVRLGGSWDATDTVLWGLQQQITTKADRVHVHTMDDVTNLATALAGKMPSGRTFALTELTDVLGASAAPAGYLLVKNADGKWQASSVAAAIGSLEINESQVLGLTADLVSIANALNGKFSTSGGALAGGISFGSSVASAYNDLSKHIALYSGYGFSITNSRFNYVAGAGAGHAFYVGNTAVLVVGSDGSLSTSQLGDINSRIESRASAYAQANANNCVQSSQAAGYVEVGVKTGSGGAGDFNYGGYYVSRIYKSGVENIQVGGRQPQLYIPNRGWFAAFPF